MTGLRGAFALAREDRSLHRDQVLTRVILTTLRVGSWLRERVGNAGALGRVWFKLFYLPVVMVHRSLCVLAGCDIPVGARIGRRLRLVHGFAGMFVATRAAIGDGCVFVHHVTIGSNDHTSDDPGARVIEGSAKPLKSGAPPA